jgi:peptide chain release factor 2
MLQYDEQRVALSNLKPELEGLGDALGIPALRERLAVLEAEVSGQDFWNSEGNGQAVLKEIKQIKDKLDSYERLSSSFRETADLIDIADEMGDEASLTEVLANVEDIRERISAQRLATLLSGEYDQNNAILAFHSGAGGTEAQDWAMMLYRMYTRWAERHGYKYQVLDYLDGEEAGIKSASILIEGTNVYGFLKSEAGVHRLVRVSPFDASGRRHTSFASVEVMPEIDDTIEIEIDEKDLKVDTYRSSGAGGQHVNKTESAIRITHIPTGVSVACQNERSQRQNRETAMRMLKSKLIEIKEREHLDRVEDIKGEHKEIGWGSQIRSYVFMPYTMAKDHRTNFEVGNINAVMDGELDGFINAYLRDFSQGKIS